MYILFLLLLLLAILLYLVFEKPVSVYFLLDSEEMKMMVTTIWLKEIKAVINVIEYKPHISIYFFGRRIYSKFKKKALNKGQSNFRALSLRDTKIKTFYGLNEPHLTGIFYAAADFFSSFINDMQLEQFPEYVPAKEYLRIEANTKVDLGETLNNFIDLKFKGAKRRERPWISQS